METILPPVEQPVVTETKPVIEESIVSRATKTALPIVENKIVETNEAPIFDFKEYQATLDSIKDPAQKFILEKAYKSFQIGANQKYQALAEDKKRTAAIEQEYQKKISEMNSWSPERLKVEMARADFIESAKTVMEAQPATQDENSMLSIEEKAKLKEMDAEIKRLKSLNEQTLIQQHQLQTQKQDEEFKAKYSNYDPRAIDTITADMLAGKANVTREHVYKAYFHDENVKRGYELGRQDERNAMRERASSASILPDGSTSSSSGITKAEGESSLNLFRRIGQKNLSEMKITKN